MSDLIDRQTLVESLYESFVNAQKWEFEASDEEMKIRANQAVATFIEAILRVRQMPSIDPVKHGKWVIDWFQVGNAIPKYICSECGYYNGTARTNFCPNCGARMDKEGKENE